jgi:putative endonuclease
MQQKQYYVYIMANAGNSTLYVGVTSNLAARVWQHKNKEYPKSFSAKYNVNKLVYYEETDDVAAAIAREKQIKAGSRKKKEALVESMNPTWKDLGKELE